ncbi:MAG: ABC transporter substrate-binding protein [Candidatus Hodarchaeales archaeon]
MNLQKGDIEKRDLEIRFIPIVCSTPLIYAQSHGFFEKNGLNVNLERVPGWSAIKELLVREKIDAAHMLTPMPLASTVGIDGYQKDLKLLMIQNTNGQALTISKENEGIKSVKNMKGFTFGVPYLFSMHYYLLSYFLAHHGINPLEDVSIIEVSPPRMPYYLKKGLVNGVFAPEPYNQIPVYQGTSFIHTLSKDIWPSHPCCSFATTDTFVSEYPNTYKLILRSILEAQWALHRSTLEEKKAIAQEISGKEYLNQPDYWVPILQVLSGDYPNGLGSNFHVPDRIDFIPYARFEYGYWILSQMQRWKQLKKVVNYREIVKNVFVSDSFEIAETYGFKYEPSDDSSISILGDLYDPSNSFEYMKKQPFSSFKSESEILNYYQDVDSIKRRLNEIADTMAEIAGGNLEKKIKITSDDEVGILEQIINEVILNIKFSRQALAEDIEKRLETEEKLKEYSENLERMVEKRTNEIKKFVINLERSNKDLELFAYVASHDLQEPLRMVSSYVQLLERRYKDKLDDNAKEFIGYAVDGAKRMQAMIDDLLNYSRVQSRGKPFEYTCCDSILDQVVKNLKLSIQDSETVITRDPLPIVKGDPHQLVQLLQNLLSNSIKFRSESSPQIHISVKKREKKYIFSVKDNGIGINPEYKDRIFILFQRLHGGDEYPGTGIGLAICKKIVERHGGEIWVESELGKGSTFSFTITATKNTIPS